MCDIPIPPTPILCVGSPIERNLARYEQIIGRPDVISTLASQLAAKRSGSTLQLPNPSSIRPEQRRLPHAHTLPVDERPHLALMNHEGITLPVHPIATVTMGNAMGRDLLQQGLAHCAVQWRGAEP